MPSILKEIAGYVLLAIAIFVAPLMAAAFG